MSSHLLFLLNCMNASFHKACYFLQLYSCTITLADAQGEGVKQGYATVSMGSESRLFWQLFCNAAMERKGVTKQFSLSVSLTLQKPGLASEVWVTAFILPFVSAIISSVQKLPVDWGCRHIWFMLLSEFWSVATTQYHLLFTWANCQQLVWLLKNNENQPHFRKGDRLLLYLATHIPLQLELLKALSGGKGPILIERCSFCLGSCWVLSASAGTNSF